MKFQGDTPRANRLLAALPPEEAAALERFMEKVVYEQSQILYLPGDVAQHVYFPRNGILSLMMLMQDGRTIEVGTIGKEGAIGAMAGLGHHVSMVQGIIQVDMTADRINVTAFRDVVRRSPALRRLLVRYNDVSIGQAQTTAACNGLHKVQARFARWLLHTSARIDDDYIPLTQEFLSQMLGVRRTSITQIAQQLLDIGVIRYHRGIIEILNRPALERASCECFRLIENQQKLIYTDDEKT